MRDNFCIYNFGDARLTDNWNYTVPGSIFWRLYRIIDVDGEASVTIDNRQIELKAGHLYLIPAFVAHEDRLRGIFTHEYVHFKIEDDTFLQYLNDCILSYEIKSDPLYDAAFSRMSLICKDFELSSSIPQEYEKDTFFTYCTQRYESLDEITRRELECILQLIIYGFIRLSRKRRAAHNERILKGKLYIDNHIAEDLPINKIAEKFGMRTESFIRAFRKSFGKTPYQYILELRLNKSKGLLLLTNQSVKEIALKCGFKDAAYFCKMFKKNSSVSPGEFRRWKGILSPRTHSS